MPSQAAPFYFQLSQCQPEWPQRPEPSTAQGCQSPSHKAERRRLGFEASQSSVHLAFSWRIFGYVWCVLYGLPIPSCPGKQKDSGDFKRVLVFALYVIWTKLELTCWFCRRTLLPSCASRVPGLCPETLQRALKLLHRSSTI